MGQYRLPHLRRFVSRRALYFNDKTVSETRSRGGAERLAVLRPIGCEHFFLAQDGLR